MKKSKHYTKQELMYVKDTTLTNEEVAHALDRSVQAIYCKRWDLLKKGVIKKPSSKPLLPVPVYKTTKQEKSPVEKMVTEKVTQMVINGINLEISKEKIVINL